MKSLHPNKIALVVLSIIFFVSLGLLFLTDDSKHLDGLKAPTATNDTSSNSLLTQKKSNALNNPLYNEESRELLRADRVELPLSGSSPVKNVLHSVPIEEIKRGCFRQDCIPSVDNPQFISVDEANNLLSEDTIGIALKYKGETRFYPFSMLVTREIVNDTIDGDPILVTYCPLCGTGIVFERKVRGQEVEFGVSGMLWQSNLLMYNRASNIEDRNLWSQVLGEAVVGPDTGAKLLIIPSDIVRYHDWIDANKNTLVLNTGNIGDPYSGNYYEVASSFKPNFDEESSPIDPSSYVFGVQLNGQFIAYPQSELAVGITTDEFAGEQLIITKSPIGEVTIIDSSENTVSFVTGFWFSWSAAHPETRLWRNN